MFKDLVEVLTLVNESLAEYERTKNPYALIVYQFASARLNLMLQQAESLPDV